VAAAFPNVTAIPVRDVLERVGAVLGDIAVAIRVMALFTWPPASWSWPAR